MGRIYVGSMPMYYQRERARKELGVGPSSCGTTILPVNGTLRSSLFVQNLITFGHTGASHLSMPVRPVYPCEDWISWQCRT